MKINIGSKNETKINALKDALKNYGALDRTQIFSLAPQTTVADQPKTLEETIRGAKERAKNAFLDCDLSFGIEDGLAVVAEARTGYMNVCVCAVYDGKEYYIGFSSAFEYPPKIIKLIFHEGLDVNQAFFETGLTRNQKIGSSEGAIGILTKGRWKRADTIKQSVIAALVILENRDLYEIP